MKLESLKLDKFKNDALKKEQMFMLNGSGTETPGGTVYFGTHGGHSAHYDYGYDSIRSNGVKTYHNRSNIRRIEMQPG